MERFGFLQNDGRPQVAPTWNGSVFYKMTGDHRSPLRGERFGFLQNDGRPVVARTQHIKQLYNTTQKEGTT
ncbi:MAG: hypothetical protein R3Y53_06520 [Bacillota bacterium]